MDGVQEAYQRSQPQIFWTSEMSACGLQYLARLVADGLRVDKGFKTSHYNQCAKVVSERFDVRVSGGQVINNMKTWRTRWTTIVNFKKISSAHFDEDTVTIKLDEKNYSDRVQKKPSEAKYFNKPLENYKYMVVIFGNQQATRLFAKGTNDALASGASESGGADTYSTCSGDMADPGSNQASPTRDAGESSSRGGSGRKRARVTVEDDDVMISNVTEAFASIADAIKQTAPPPPPTIPKDPWKKMKDISVFDRAILHITMPIYVRSQPLLINAFYEIDLDDQMVWVSRYIKDFLSA